MYDHRDINEYLFYEFALDIEDQQEEVREDWPFKLTEKGSYQVHGRECPSAGRGRQVRLGASGEFLR